MTSPYPSPSESAVKRSRATSAKCITYDNEVPRIFRSPAPTGVRQILRFNEPGLGEFWAESFDFPAMVQVKVLLARSSKRCRAV